MTELDIFSDIEFDSDDELAPDCQLIRGGFSGIMEDVTLADIIQLACLENRDRKLVVYNKDDTGEIYFKGGAVVHAKLRDLKGEDAFYEILSWERGNFKFINCECSEKTIEVPWNFLIIEALRKKDEGKAQDLEEKEGFIPKILIVDDSKFFLSRIKQLFKDEIKAKLIGEAKNGKAALAFLSVSFPDLITLDINMPVMTGDIALKHIMVKSPAPVVLISTFNQKHTSKIMEFLRLGAVDFISKPGDPDSWTFFTKRLKEIINLVPLLNIKNIKRARNLQKALEKQFSTSAANRLVVFIGGIGGLLELQKILPYLRLGPQDGVLILQQMCRVFFEPFANYMDEFCPFSIKFMKEKASLHGSQAWVLDTYKSYQIDSEGSTTEFFIKELSDTNVTMEKFFSNLAEIYNKDLIFVVLSGAPKELLPYLYEVVSRDGSVICQHPDTCLFPKTLKEFLLLDLAKEVLPPEEMASKISEMLDFRR